MTQKAAKIDPQDTISTILSPLNSAQLRAVQHSPSVPLQILAGPGSGKTKVLTSRVAHLILHHALPPASICAVTFTNKAANEMRRRLTELIGEEYTAQVKIGTFHALCALFLRKYANIIGLERNFTVCDSEESKKLVASLLKPHRDELAAGDITLKESTVLSMISKAKARGLDATAMAKEFNATSSPFPSATDQINSVVSAIYASYESILRQTNSLDFDDLLLFGVKLFRSHLKAVEWCKHVLVDEFQDTNTTQYELMHQLALYKCITIVGDPDQSIYGWRFAEIGNFSRMQKDYPQTQQILLEENYRSTGSILTTSLAIVSQDQNRVHKSLFTSHPIGSAPVLRLVASERDEAASIAAEVKRLVAYTGGLLKYGDFAILLRFTALSRSIENALQKQGIPSLILGGHKFFERLEVKDLLSYLQLLDNPGYDPAFLRAVHVPARGIGEKTLEELSLRARNKQLSLLVTAEKICDGRIPDIKPPIKRKLDDFIKVMRRLRKLAIEGELPPDLIRHLLQCIEYEEHLKKTQSDWESRWENVQELITFASEVRVDPAEDDDDLSGERPTPLRMFLQASMLSSEGDRGSEESSKEKVTIATCHAAKGLEWPVVFVPAVESGTFPFYRTEDTEEERRLLYVACTRAQCLLYLSHAEKRTVAGETKNKNLSPFLAVIKEAKQLFTDALPVLDLFERRAVSRMLRRPEPEEQHVQRLITQHEQQHESRVLYDVMGQNSLTQPWKHDQHQLSKPRDAPSFTTGFVPSGQAIGQGHPRIVQHPIVQHSVQETYGCTPTGRSRGEMSTLPTLLPKSTIPSSNLLKSLRQPAPALQKALPETQATTSVIGVERKTLVQQPTSISVGVKRRLGMGRGPVGYSNKKFKPPT